MDIYTTQTDYTALLRFALTLPVKLYSAKGVLTQTCDLQDAHTEGSFYLFPEEEALLLQAGTRDFSAKYEEGCCIWMEPCGETDYGFYCPGGLACHRPRNSVKALYGKLQRYIHSNYHKSFVGTWIGPDLYSAWKARKEALHFSFFVDAQSFCVPRDALDLPGFLEVIQREGYCIHPEQQNVRKQSPHENTDSYVISTPDGKLSESLHAGIRWYLPESEAVFLSQTQKNQAWIIIMDQRYYETAAGKQLYESILKLIRQKGRQGEASAEENG